MRFAVASLTLMLALAGLALGPGAAHAHDVTPALPPAPGLAALVLAYLRLGIEHIATGFDHLAFVWGLMLLCPTPRLLVKTVTAFTAAHSVTLALAVVGWINVPPAPTEATIALSIVFLANELACARRGRLGWGARRPWLVAFVFGLLHGLGFAGALTQVGLPYRQVPVALICFNAGVELGQLAFVALASAAIALLHKLRSRLPFPWHPAVPAYMIGAGGAYLLWERLAWLLIGPS